MILISVKTVSGHCTVQELSHEDYKVEIGHRIFSMITTRCYTVVQNVGNLKLCSMEGNIVLSEGQHQSSKRNVET